jgi:hypothetical protein
LVGLAIIVGGVSLVLSVFILVKWGRLPAWTHRDVLAFLAMIATIGGAMILSLANHEQLATFTAQANRLIDEMVRERKGDLSPAIGDVLKRIIEAQSFVVQWQSVGIILVLLSLGLVISARTLKGKLLGGEFEMGTGEDGKPAIPVVIQQPKADPVPTTDVSPAPKPDAAAPPKPLSPE